MSMQHRRGELRSTLLQLRFPFVTIRLRLVLALPFALFVGCGDDDTPSEITPSAGRAGANTTGRAGSGQGVGGNSTLPTTPMTEVQCGSTTCSAPGAAIGFIMPCCADEANSKCGMSSPMGGSCTVPSPGDTRCPSVQAMGLFMIPSCCTPDNQCGIDASMFGFGGCTDLESAAKQSMSMGSGTMIPAPRRCDANDLGDAGADDAGK